MNKETLNDVLLILNQIGGPVKTSYQTKQITGITEELIYYHIKKINYLLASNISFNNEYNISDIFSLHMCINYIIIDLGSDEFETATGKDLYNFGYRLLMYIKNTLLTYSRK